MSDEAKRSTIVDELGTELLSSSLADTWGRHIVAALQMGGVAPRSFIVFQAQNSAVLLAAIYGALRSDFVPVIIGATLSDGEREAMLADLPYAALVRDEDLATLVATDQVAARTWGDTFSCRPVHFTSGTSGRPKAVWSGWLNGDDSSALANEERDTWGLSRDDVHLVSGPLSHSAPLRFALHTLLQGGSVLVPPRFDASVAAALVESTATTAFMAPIHLQRMLDATEPRRSSLRLLAHAGAPCPEPLRRRALRVFGAAALVEFYGSTEGQFTRCGVAEWLDHPGTVGRARAGRTLRSDAEGHLWCRTPPYARFEYWNDAEKTRAAWDGEWFTVGDLGHLDDEGYVYLDGRRSDLIISGGVNVYPAEIELALATLARVGDVAAFGVDDDEWGQRVCLVYTGDADPEAVAAHAAEHLASYKRPKTIVKVASLPRTHTGKIERSTLASLLKDAR